MISEAKAVAVNHEKKEQQKVLLWRDYYKMIKTRKRSI